MEHFFAFVPRKGSKKIWFLFLVTFTVLPGCSKQLAPTVVPALPGQSRFRVEVNERRRAWQAYLHKRKTERLTRKANAKSEKRKRRKAKADSDLVRQNLKKQSLEAQKRMSESQKEAEKNRPFRNLRQRLRIWRYK